MIKPSGRPKHSAIGAATTMPSMRRPVLSTEWPTNQRPKPAKTIASAIHETRVPIPDMLTHMPHHDTFAANCICRSPDVLVICPGADEEILFLGVPHIG